MRKLLLLAYHYPPEPAAGARRPGFLARYLPEFGWDVTVLTRPLGLRAPGERAEDPHALAAPVLGARFERRMRSALGARDACAPAGGRSRVRELLRQARAMLLFPDRAAPWLPGAVATGLRATARTRYDAIASTAMPASTHVAAAIVAAVRGLPWIADYRDLWSGNPYLRYGPIRTWLESVLERRLLRRARTVTTISAALAAQLETLLERPVRVIPNGYDPAEWEPLRALDPNAFQLCYTGSLYDGERSPELLFEALAALQREGDDAAATRVFFFGPNSDRVGELARRHGVESIVEQRGVVPRDRALAAQRTASNLLIFLSRDPATYDELGSKVFEYAGARRPVLAFGPRQSALRPYVDRHALGWYASDLEEAKAALRQAHRRFVAGDRELRVAPGAVSDARDLARAFAVELDASV